MTPQVFRRLIRDTGGNVLPMFAAGILPLIALVGGAMDISVAYMARSKLQKSCDAGVLAGRQVMEGTSFRPSDRDEARRFFEFNFPDGTYSARDLTFAVEQNPTRNTELLGSASAAIPTGLMRIFGYDTIPVSVDCNAAKDVGDNDIVLVLDVTGSMAFPPSTGGPPKIDSLRSGAVGLYRALEDANGSTTRFGIVPYSHTVNIARSLGNRDILTQQQYVDVRTRFGRLTYTSKTVHINQSTWGTNGNNSNANTQGFRTSGDGCIEERASIGRSTNPIRYATTITLADVDTVAASANDTAHQFGRYDPGVQRGMTQYGCPSEATTLRTYDSETAYTNAINAATSRVTGGTYHDIGMLWGLRFISRNGYFAADNPETRGPVPVNQHIVFMTDGRLETGPTLYSAYGVETYQQRLEGSGTQNSRHISRFKDACTLAKAMRVTVWVIALDVTDTSDIEGCATSSSNFFVSDGSDLEDVFAEIGRGIGNLRLTR
ncbi:MAG: TadE/TadG family type IV pilus assembly protein [Erythrobacter sp.]|jgi:Flp pilus assembly protein TadG